MKFKEFLIKSGGVIFSIALLCSMCTMANAAGLIYSVSCSICGNNFDIQGDTTISSVYAHYQEVYNVDTISDLSLTEGAYEDKPSVGLPSGKNYLQLTLYKGGKICITYLENVISEHKTSNTNNLSSPGASHTPITVTAEASTFDVTVPTRIPLVINADGGVTAPTDVKIVNGSAGSVQVSSIAMNNGDWSLTDYNGGNRSKLAEAKVDSKKLGLSLTAAGNSAATSKDGSQAPLIDVSKWTMAGGTELPITVGAIATASSAKSASEVTAANVVFTLAWS